jgi:amino acid transporter
MIRGVGLRSAVAINVATMVGAGPFITLPLVVAALHGSVSAIAWVLGALIALCDGLVWAELAARYPRSGGTYTYLREAFGRRGPGRFVAFLFVWQFLFWAPLILASGYIGFAQYAAYLVPALGGAVPTHLLAAATGVVVLLSLYRTIPQVASTALVLGAIALATLLAVAFAGLTHPYAPIAHTVSSTLTFGVGVVALGGALVNTLYDYSGYGDVCALGDEVIAPARTIPRAVVLSVLFVGAAYVLLNLGVAAAVAPKEIAASNAIASLVAQRAFGAPFAVAVTLAVMVTAFASTYGLLLGASRIPYAAALEGDFLPQFARLHRGGRFPAVSLVTIGLLALPATLLSLDLVINALTAGIVLVQGAGQIVALALARRAAPDAPFRVPLYPLPPLVALAGWLFLFWSTGAIAIAFGLATLAVGAIVFLVRARFGRIWPFAAPTIAGVLALTCAAPPAASAAVPSFGHAAIVRDSGGEPMLTVDRKPFFFLGGAFFYERIPRSRWRDAMVAMRALGANTLDLYVPWNWHELADGDFDFTGRTSPRRDLREVLRLGKELGFRFVVRPGPVIRNEWRNGGYPAWLLRRAAYGMPLHDVLEGRYPATATLQNAHSDAAASEWMRNAAHRYYAARWLRHALAEFRPVADRVIAVQLDDDQGAYLDNDTYPAPHLHAYLGWLERGVREVVGARTPVFINTFEMKVPSSSPVWAMGNWYQSDAYAIGEHDRAELAFATATLRTQHGVPLAYSEFQAGWLAGPEDPLPRPADPTNTALALGELAGLGLKGLIDFPLHDTLAPFGWEAPFSNALYRWDAAFALDAYDPPERPVANDTLDRLYTTRRLFGALSLYGPALEEAHRLAAIALPYDGRRNAFAAAAALKLQLAACRARGAGCDAIDPLAVEDARLRRFRYLVAPPGTPAGLVRRARRLHVRVIGSVGAARNVVRTPHATLLAGPHGSFAVVENWSAQPLAVDPRRFGPAFRALRPFVLPPRDARIVVANLALRFVEPRHGANDALSTTCAFDGRDERGRPVFIAGYPRPAAPFPRNARSRPSRAPRGARSAVPHCEIVARVGETTRRFVLAGAQTAAPGQKPWTLETFTVVDYARHPLPIDSVRLAPHTALWSPHALTPPRTGEGARARVRDVFMDGMPAIVLENPRVRAVAVPSGGARVVSFGPRLWTAEIDRQSENAFDATGALRDDVLVQPPPSPTDRIAKYTHTYPAGTFNRPYAACTFTGGTRSGATAGDAVGVYLAYDAPDVVPNGALFERVLAIGGADRLVADLRLTPHGDAPAQRLVSSSAISERGTTLDDGAGRYRSDRPATLDPRAGGVAFTRATTFWLPGTPRRYGLRVFSVAWRPEDVASATWTPARSNGTLRIVFAPGGWRRLTFASSPASGRAGAEAFVRAERAWAAANPAPASEDGEVAKRYTQSPQKRPSESSCGFESHLPHD